MINIGMGTQAFISTHINESHMLYVCVCALQPVYMEVINESHMLYVCVCCIAGVHGSYQ